MACTNLSMWNCNYCTDTRHKFEKIDTEREFLRTPYIRITCTLIYFSFDFTDTRASKVAVDNVNIVATRMQEL